MNLADTILYHRLYQRRAFHLAEKICPFLSNFGNLLDFGCGNMCTAREIKKHLPNLNITGVDVIEDQNLYRTPLASDLTFVLNKQKVIPFEDGFFEQVLCVSTLHHTSDPEYYFKELQRVLRQGGRFVLVEEMYAHGLDYLWIAGADLLSNKLKRGVPTPLEFRTYKFYKELFNRCGLNIAHHCSVRPAFPWQRLEVFALDKS
jgi:ubiquinone/menaquinone biosynthesis C-methylase UbiE